MKKPDVPIESARKETTGRLWIATSETLTALRLPARQFPLSVIGRSLLDYLMRQQVIRCILPLWLTLGNRISLRRRPLEPCSLCRPARSSQQHSGPQVLSRRRCDDHRDVGKERA